MGLTCFQREDISGDAVPLAVNSLKPVQRLGFHSRREGGAVSHYFTPLCNAVETLRLQLCTKNVHIASLALIGANSREPAPQCQCQPRYQAAAVVEAAIIPNGTTALHPRLPTHCKVRVRTLIPSPLGAGATGLPREPCPSLKAVGCRCWFDARCRCWRRFDERGQSLLWRLRAAPGALLLVRQPRRLLSAWRRRRRLQRLRRDARYRGARVCGPTLQLAPRAWRVP